MDRSEYRRLSEATHRIGDEFYRCVNRWLKDPTDLATNKSCLVIAADYEKALNKQIEYLREVTPSKQRDEAIENCEIFLNSLGSQLRLLQKGFGTGH